MTGKIRHFLDLDEIPAETLKEIIRNAHALKKQKFSPPQIFAGLTLAMVFDKRSTRTRISFEVAMKQLGGHTIILTKDDMNSKSETAQDTANVLSRFVDGAMFRMGDHARLKELSKFATIPFINGMTDHSHPCQIMADIMTIEEKLGAVQGRKIVWLGDYSNVAKTFAQAAAIWDFELVVTCPEDLKPTDKRKNVTYIKDAKEAAKNADILVTDTWVSLGEEGKSVDKFKPYQVNKALMALAKPTALFMHCMPIYHGNEVTDEVLATPASVIYDEAENRLHAQKAILAWCLENSGVKV